jgi:HTH-type transcriptional regulator/antitoxin HigA
MAAKAQNKARDAATTDMYFALVKSFPLRPLRSEAELDAAIAVIDGLIDRDRLDPGEEDYLDVLGDLVKKYETEHHPMEPLSDADMLRHLIESRETTQLKLARATGVAVSTISEILSGKRRLNRNHIEAFSGHFRVSPAVFMKG